MFFGSFTPTLPFWHPQAPTPRASYTLHLRTEHRTKHQIGSQPLYNNSPSSKPSLMNISTRRYEDTLMLGKILAAENFAKAYCTYKQETPLNIIMSIPFGRIWCCDETRWAPVQCRCQRWAQTRWRTCHPIISVPCTRERATSAPQYIYYNMHKGKHKRIPRWEELKRSIKYARS